MTESERDTLYAHTVAMTTGLIGWFTCSMFASVAFGWTFYYMLALVVAAREMTRDRLTAARALRVPGTKPMSVPVAKFSRRMARGVA